MGCIFPGAFSFSGVVGESLSEFFSLWWILWSLLSNSSLESGLSNVLGSWIGDEVLYLVG